jgi:hypothetical protein
MFMFILLVILQLQLLSFQSLIQNLVLGYYRMDLLICSHVCGLDLFGDSMFFAFVGFLLTLEL